MKPSIEIAAKIAEALDVSLDFLMGLSSEFVKGKKMVNTTRRHQEAARRGTRKKYLTTSTSLFVMSKSKKNTLLKTKKPDSSSGFFISTSLVRDGHVRTRIKA